jgi:hypothetical protein
VWESSRKEKRNYLKFLSTDEVINRECFKEMEHDEGVVWIHVDKEMNQWLLVWIR